MNVISKQDRNAMDGPAEWFTGDVSVDMLFGPEAPGRVGAASVTFRPAARTAWHTHPYGQALFVTSGFGRAQQWGGPVRELGPGDVAWFPAGEKHWHGAAPDCAMTHVAIQEYAEDGAADWMEHVSDEQYAG